MAILVGVNNWVFRCDLFSITLLLPIDELTSLIDTFVALAGGPCAMVGEEEGQRQKLSNIIEAEGRLVPVR